MRAPLYFVECSYGRLGIEFQPTDRDANSRHEIVRQIRNGSIEPVRILEVTEPCDEFPRGQVLDVTAELVAEAEQEREPASFEELGNKLRNMLAEHDRKRDLRKHGVFGW